MTSTTIEWLLYAVVIGVAAGLTANTIQAYRRAGRGDGE